MLFNASGLFTHSCFILARAGNKKWSFQMVSFAIHFPCSRVGEVVPAVGSLSGLSIEGGEVRLIVQ